MPSEKEFEYIPKLKSYLARYKTKITNVTLYEALYLSQQLGLEIPTSREWHMGRRYFEKKLPNEERNFIMDELEFCDSILVFDKYKTYLFENTKVDLENSSYEISHSNSREIDWLPRCNGYIQQIDEITGLPKIVGETPCSNYNNAYFWVIPKRTRAIIRGHWRGFHPEPPLESRRYSIDACWSPEVSYPKISFRFISRRKPENIDKKIVILRQKIFLREVKDETRMV
ncbi:MAG: hypothetical protein KAK00_10500 [Nanoarchaeota archaeon]|nr:hypothetical protein [Nanoarchaeota archaeon]